MIVYKMHILATVFLVIGVSVVKSDLSENPSAGSAEAAEPDEWAGSSEVVEPADSAESAEAAAPATPAVPAAPIVTCEPKSKWGDLTSFIGEQVITKGHETMMNTAMYCINLKTPAAMVPVYAKCYTGAAKILQKELGSGTPRIPTTKDFKRWFENSMECFVREFNITTNATSYDPEQFEKMLTDEDWTESAEDKITIRTILTECIAARTGATPIQTMMSIQRCIINEVTSLCQSRGQSEGMILKVAKSALTLWDDSVCSGVQVKFDEPISVCVAKVQKRWADDGLAKFTSTSMMKFNKSNIKNAMHFLKKYAESFLMNLAECISEEMGFYNETTGMFNYTAGEDFLTNLEGWNSTEVKDSVVMAFKGCEVMQNESELMKMNEMDRDMSVVKTMINFNGCFMTKFIDICGLNNDLVSMFVPLLNSEFVGSIFKDFTEKNGSLALMQLLPAFQEKFQDFFSTMMAMMASL